MRPKVLEPPDHFLEQVWYSAIMAAAVEDDPENPWPDGTPQAQVWELAVQADREREKWEASLPTGVERELIEQEEWEERARNTPKGEPSPDDYVRLIKSACKNILSFLATDAPTCVVNSDRRRLRDLVERFTLIPTKFERDYGRTPMQEPDDSKRGEG